MASDCEERGAVGGLQSGVLKLFYRLKKPPRFDWRGGTVDDAVMLILYVAALFDPVPQASWKNRRFGRTAR